ncbi:hypothetical protein RJZ56_001712 [Blastomyces dermatitidis]|uniref:Uncharacterized protein n=2 Tax=Blastomyces TaxID=229219 RepID=A0A179UTR9_BLAGS|nr:uncharacterized protein BDBG_06457 [Blastomyces gilchristii SLH14081]EGE80835.1 hypothetical protein BDDG_03776 [Blastomyces dermatitidis ATCC 18188]OAT10639.1 hypothetical protein BDBG_06457 [Blastomyces gilchristii SLH14081]
MVTPSHFPLAKRSLDSLGLRRRYESPPRQFFRPELRARASSSSALAQRAGSMRFATAVPESYIKMTRKPPKKRNNRKKNNKKKQKGGRSKNAAIEDLPLSKRWALAAANAFRPSSKSDAKQIQSRKLRRVVKRADLSPKISRPVPAQAFATPPKRKSSLHAGAKTRAASTGNNDPLIEKPLPSTPGPKVLDIPDIEEERPRSSKSTIGAEDTPVRQNKVGRPEASERWPVLSPWKPPHSWESNYCRVEERKESQQPSSQPNDGVAPSTPTEVPPPLPPSKPSTPPRGTTLRHSRLRIASNWAANNSHLDTIYQAVEPNDPVEMASQNEHSELLPNMIPSGNNKAVTQPLEVNSESNRVNQAVGNNDNTTFKPNPFRNRYRTVSSPQHSSQQQPQSDLREFSFEFSTDCQNPGPTNNQKQAGAHMMDDKEVSNSYTTPRNENAASKIPRASPKVLTPPSTGEVNRLKKIASPRRRSSIPIPSRMVHGRDKVDVSALHASPPLKTTRNSSSAYTSTIYEDETPGGQKELGSQKTIDSIDPNDTGHMGLHGNDSTPPTSLPEGYRSKELAAAGRSGPQLRISPEADKVIMGNMTDALEDSSQKSTRNRANRHSSSKRLSGDSIFGSFTPKYLMHSQSNSSLNPSTSSPMEGKVAVARDKKLKKARSTDATYAKMPKNEHMKKFGTNPFYDDGIAGRVPLPGMFNERYPFLNSSSPDPPRYSEADATSQGYKALPSSPLAESTTLIDDNDVVYSQPGSHQKYVVPSPLDSHTSADQFHNKKENEPFSERDASSTSRHRSASQRLLHRSSRHCMSEHGSHGKSKLNNVATSNPSTELVQRDTFEIPRRKHRESSAKHRSASTSLDYPKAKESSTRAGGVLSNFRGLFTKQKNDSITASANSGAGASSSTTAKRKDLERVKAANSGKLSTGSPMERSFSRRARGISRADKRGEDNRGTSSRDSNVDQSRPASDALTVTSQMADSPALSGISNVSALCMNVLNSARDEPNGAKKEKFLQLGKILVEVVNHSNDAERAMLAAVQAAKESEIACALAKENALRIAQVAQDWINCSNSDNTSLR